MARVTSGSAGAARPALAHEALVWIGAVGIAAIAVLRCLAFFAPQVVFDVDPRFAPDPLGALGPAGSLRLDVLLLVASAAALLGETLGGRRVSWIVLLAALAPVPVVLVHGVADGGDLWRGATWMSGAIAAATLAHVARRPVMRRVLIILLAAVLAPLLVRGVQNVTTEYAETIREFERNRAAIIADRGWEPESAAARIYERRLRQRQPTGWSVTTNIYAAYMAFGTVFVVGIACALWRRNGRSASIGLVGVGALIAAMLWMTGALGAIGAVTLAGVAMVLPFVPGVSRVARRRGGAIAIAGVAAVLLGVVVRGAILPEGFGGERSLLFRWHYMVSSASIVAEHPGIGVGPDGFQEAYVRHRVPRNPEEVTSPHSIFVEWLSDLGVLAVAWVALFGLFTWGAGRRVGGVGAAPAESIGAARPALLAALTVAALGIAPAITVEAHVLNDTSAMARIAGFVLYVLLAGGLATALDRLDRSWIDWAFAAGALAVAFQAQIEMTMTRPGAAVWTMCVLGVAGALFVREDEAPRLRPGGAIVATGLVALAGWLWFGAAVPAGVQQQAMIDATRILAPPSEPFDAPLAPAEEADRRRRTAGKLVTAHGAWPINDGVLLAAAEQMLRAQGLERRPGARLEIIDEALSLLARLEDSGAALGMSVALRRQRAVLSGDPEDRAAAVALAERLVVADPHGLSARARLGDVRWDGGDRIGAAEAYRAALAIDAQFELDPLKRFSDRDRAVIESRIAAAEEPGGKELGGKELGGKELGGKELGGKELEGGR